MDIVRNTGCFFYFDYHDGNATIPTCGYFNKFPGFCPCGGCKHYVSNFLVRKAVLKYVEMMKELSKNIGRDLSEADVEVRLSVGVKSPMKLTMHIAYDNEPGGKDVDATNQA